MNRKMTTLATLFAAGAFAAHAGAPALSALTAKSGADLSVTEVACGGDKKDEKKDGSCGAKKDGKCGAKKDGKCGGDKKKGEKKDGSCGKGSCGSKKDGKDASCGKGSCGSKKG
jgi:hypothetical protein